MFKNLIIAVLFSVAFVTSGISIDKTIESFQAYRAYDVARQELEAMNRTIAGRIDSSYTCRLKPVLHTVPQ